MINIHCEFQSRILSTRVEVDVYLPNVIQYLEDERSFKEQYTYEPLKTLFLLHGAWDSARQWIENTSVMRLAEEANIALVLPSVGNTFYANTRTGLAYEDYFMQELFGFVRALFPLSEKREDNYICGVSMGGYGALKAVLKEPSLFSKCAVMSGVVDIAYSARIIRTLGVETKHLLGSWKELKDTEYDLRPMVEKALAQNETLPELLLIVSEGDYLRETNESFHAFLEEKGVSHTFKEYPGIHNWAFWDAHLKECMDFIVK